MSAAIYARQSIDKKDSVSIEGQIAQCRKFAGEDALVFQDKGYSGKNIKRPAFTELINAVESGTVKKIYVYRLDRFSRNILDFGKLWEILEQYGVEFQSVTEQFDTSSPMGRAMLNIVLVFAQLERETTAERVKDNYLHRFKLGEWTGGPAPYGFDLTKISVDGRRVSSLVANEEKSQIVKFIFEEYSKPDTSLRSLAALLTDSGVHGPKREQWDSVTLSRLLHSPVYVKATPEVFWYYLSKGLKIELPVEAFDGVHASNVIGKRDRSKNKYNALEDQMLTVSNHLGFIDADLWMNVQEKLEKNRQISRANAGKYSWLTGLMKCAKCGYSLKINYSKSENKLHLLCSGKSNLGICDCKVKIDVAELETYVADQISDILKSSPPIDIVPDNSDVSSKVLAVEQKIDRLVNALAESSDVSASYISKQIEALHKQREDLLQKIPSEAPTMQRINFKDLTFDEKKIIAREFIERISIENKKVNIIWKI
ncbi:MAG: recombinase family protein [Clostridia bacterium]|nr:recombinase family protein [Clostridia bacterium]